MMPRRRKERRRFTGFCAWTPMPTLAGCGRSVTRQPQPALHDCQIAANFPASRRGDSGIKRSGSAKPLAAAVSGDNSFAASGDRAVQSTIDAQKASLVGDAQLLADQQAAPVERAGLRRFIALFYQHAPPSDVTLRSAAELYAAALAL